MTGEVPESPQKSSHCFPPVPRPSPSPFPATSVVGLVAGDHPRSEGVWCWELIPLSSPGSGAKVPCAGPEPAHPSPVETFPVGSLGPEPGCEEPFAGYLQFITSRVITSPVLTLLGCLTNTSGAAATGAMPLDWSRGWDLPEGRARTPGPRPHCRLVVLGQRAAGGFAPRAHAAAGGSPCHPHRQHMAGKIAVSCPEVLGVLLLSRPACQRPPARLQPPLAGVSPKSIPAPHSRAEKAIKESQTPHAKQNTVYGA